VVSPRETKPKKTEVVDQNKSPKNVHGTNYGAKKPLGSWEGPVLGGGKPGGANLFQKSEMKPRKTPKHFLGRVLFFSITYVEGEVAQSGVSKMNLEEGNDVKKNDVEDVTAVHLGIPIADTFSSSTPNRKKKRSRPKREKHRGRHGKKSP